MSSEIQNAYKYFAKYSMIVYKQHNELCFKYPWQNDYTSLSKHWFLIPYLSANKT